MEITQGEWVAEVETTKGSEGMTRMEATYLLCVASGMTHKEVARTVGRSPETVSKGLKRAYYRLGVTRATAAVAKAQAMGWIRYAGKAAMCLALTISLCTGSDDGMRRGGRTQRLTRREAEVQIHA